MKTFLDETIEFHFTPQAKAKLMSLLDNNFKVRRIEDDLIILEELEKDPDELEGEENFKVNVRTK